MSRSIDEEAAWALVRAVPAALPGNDSLTRIHHDSSPDLSLQVEASGRWEASHPVTDEARDLLDLYLPLQRRAELVVGQLAQSLDGRIATESGHSRFVTGPADIRRLHRLRALVDAVVVGAGTVASDDPRLTVREVEGRSPVRVVLDPDGRLSSDRKVFTDGASPTLVIRAAAGSADRSTPNGDVLTLPLSGPGGFDPALLVQILRERGLARVLVEGGGITVSRFLQADALDRLHVTVAPLLMGSGRPALTLDPIDTLDQALRPSCRHFHLGPDLLFDLDLR